MYAQIQKIGKPNFLGASKQKDINRIEKSPAKTIEL
jgi:hypothetical protein